MDELKLKLSTKFMRNIAAKMIAKAIYKKTGCKVNICLNDLDVSIYYGETHISANVEAKLDSSEFKRIMENFE